MVKTSNLAEKEKWVLKKIVMFYSDPCNMEKFVDIINGCTNKNEIQNSDKTRKISLRLIDWFVTNYAKKNNISYPIQRPNGDIELFLPYHRYRDQLSSYPKKLFDPFCRGDIYSFTLNNSEESVKTAICQMHFFKWAIENLLLDYITQHSEEIYQDMQNGLNKKKDNQIKRTKQQLSKSIHQKIICQETKTKISFGSNNTD